MASVYRGNEPYNPLDEENLARGVADALERQPVHRLPPPTFFGPGLYALYYVGDFDLYAPLAEVCRRQAGPDSLDVGPGAIPIYVGKAAASGSRHGNVQGAKDKTLHLRIGKHLRSIEAAQSTLKASDFRVRYLRVRDIWIPLGEYGLLQRYTPVWNKVLDGFGNNDPGKGRYDQARSPWDTLHPGRSWAKKLAPHPQPQDVHEDRVRLAIAAITRHQPVPESLLTDGPQEPTTLFSID
ncbi:Eco29kI family restriction endonuclease [Nonomuraea sp. NPDC001636]|uniref:Eco29kI family restriction endonuclease n=1 Tax=Nonomuraea sp. NPDC001636 TaxID=3154391 RepID=UPI00331FB394